MPTTEANWRDNINNRLTENHACCVMVVCRSEFCLGRPVIVWLTDSREPQVACVSQAIMTDRGRLIALCDLHQRGIISDTELLRGIQPNILGYLQGYGFDRSTCLATALGLPASPGQALGRVVFRQFSRDYQSDLPPIFVVPEIAPDDIHDVEESVAVVTSHGGMTSHAAVVCRGMGLPCVARCEQLRIDTLKRVVYFGDGVPIQENTPVLIDGTVGRVEFGTSGDLVPRYCVSDRAVECFGLLKNVVRDASSPAHFKTLSLDDQMHIARLKNRLKELNLFP